MSTTIDELKKTVSIPKPTEYLVTKILQKKGEFTRIVYSRPLKLRKSCGDENFGFKMVEMTCRLGIEYDNIKNVQEKRESGELPFQNAGLSGRKWLVYGHLLLGKDDKMLVRIYTVKNPNKVVSYTLNGQPVDKEQLREFCLASEFAEKPDLDCFDLDISAILSLS